MGCAQGSKADPMILRDRRRLSFSCPEGRDGLVPEEDRGLIAQLSEDDVLQMMNHTEGQRRLSIGSNTDNVRVSFASKTIEERGDKDERSTFGLGFTCRKGLKPEGPNQDSWGVLQLGDYSIYGVFDGHGKRGHDVSEFVKDCLPKLMLRDQRFPAEDVQASMRDAFKTCQRIIESADKMLKLSAQMSGTTATVVVHDHEKNKITIAHVADSTCVLGRLEEAADQSASGKPKMTGEALTRDHKPDLKDERARIEGAGGRVMFDGYANYRVYAKCGLYPGLNMSRCLGDLLGHADAGCSAEPEVSERDIAPEDQFLLLCSDGVWEFISPQEAVDIVAEFGPGQAMAAAEKLAKEAWDRWIREEGGAVVDDITAVVIYLHARSVATSSGGGNENVVHRDQVVENVRQRDLAVDVRI